MKKLVFITASILMAVSCHVEKQDDLADSQQLSSDRFETFFVSAEGNTQETKTYIDEDLQVRWNTGDCITLFNGNTINAKYRFNGQDGDIEGSFERVRTTSPVYTVGSKLDHIYAVYPYRADTKINRTGTTITMTLPAEQSYRENSFGPGANATVAVSDDENLDFKNVGGYLVLRLYGDDVRVSRITLQGNNHEKIAGKATVAVGLETLPTVAMDVTATETLSIVCEAPVELNDSCDEGDEFWFVLPPTTFRNGFTITVTDEYGCTFTQSISESTTILQNTVVWMDPIHVVPDYNAVYVEFEDPNFKAYCVENFDDDGDGEISIAEALRVTTIDVNTDNISSLEGIMSFVNLHYLTAQGSAGAWFGSGGPLLFGDTSVLEPFPTNPEPGTVLATGQLSEVNLSHHNRLMEVTIRANNPAYINLSDCPNLYRVTVQFCGISEINVSNDTRLRYLYCSKDQLTTLDVGSLTHLLGLHCEHNLLATLEISKNTTLRWLNCGFNQLTSLDVSNQIILGELWCQNNQLTALDVSNNPALIHLWCYNNDLTNLDVSSNPALEELFCSSNQLTNLDVSYNPALINLGCHNNQLTNLDVSNHTALISLECYNNLLTTLDVSNNTALENLWCGDNQLTTLDVSNNTTLHTLRCFNNQLTTLDVSNNPVLFQLWCYGNPNLTELWLDWYQHIGDLQYDPDVTTIYYRRQGGRTTSIDGRSTSKKYR